MGSSIVLKKAIWVHHFIWKRLLCVHFNMRSRYHHRFKERWIFQIIPGICGHRSTFHPPSHSSCFYPSRCGSPLTIWEPFHTGVGFNLWYHWPQACDATRSTRTQEAHTSCRFVCTCRSQFGNPLDDSLPFDGFLTPARIALSGGCDRHHQRSPSTHALLIFEDIRTCRVLPPD